MSVGDLAGAVMAASGNITALLDRMAAEGLIERRAAPTDRRGQQVRASKPGRALFGQMARDHAGWIDELLSRFEGLGETVTHEVTSMGILPGLPAPALYHALSIGLSETR